MKKTAPSLLKKLGRGLGIVGRKIGRVQSWLILTLFYFLLLAPVALIFKCFADPLRLSKKGHPPWHPKSQPKEPWSWARAQF